MKSERIKDIEKLGFGADIDVQLLWHRHGWWILEILKAYEILVNQYIKLQKENDLIIDKLADIRQLFDESDMETEGIEMEDMISSPYAVAIYAENKLKRLIEKVKLQQEELDD
jgi:hypothetical protein